MKPLADMSNTEMERELAERLGIVECDQWEPFALGMMAKGPCGHADNACSPACFWPAKYTSCANAVAQAREALTTDGERIDFIRALEDLLPSDWRGHELDAFDLLNSKPELQARAILAVLRQRTTTTP